MTSARAVTPTDRATVLFVGLPEPALQCSHCGGLVSDDDAECPTCDSPIDWGASADALRAWQGNRADRG
jgi:hypothetical protein